MACPGGTSQKVPLNASTVGTPGGLPDRYYWILCVIRYMSIYGRVTLTCPALSMSTVVSFYALTLDCCTDLVYTRDCQKPNLPGRFRPGNPHR